jgi:hypothetical protein
MSTDTEDFRRCLSRIEKVHDMDGWNNPTPKLYALHCTKTGRNIKAIGLGIGECIWALAPPGDVMGGIAQYVTENAEKMLRPFRHAHWCGLVLVMEVWVGDDQSEGGFAQLLEDARNRQISTRADRRSARVVYGLTREMVPGFLMRFEDDPHRVVDRSDESFPGGVLHGLSTLVATIDELLDHA